MVGVSGGIGSGKSSVAEALAAQGAAVVDTDHVAHALTGKDGGAMAAIRAAFGSTVIGPDGALDRVAMRKRVFSDGAARKQLEGILHPLIREQSREQCRQATAPYVLLLIPLLAETWQASPYDFLDRILIVDCEEAVQVARVMARSGMSAAEVQAIMATQADRATRRALADDIVSNNGEWAALEAPLKDLHQRYLSLASQKVKASC